MTSDPVSKDSDDDLDGCEYFHPVDVLGHWIHELIELVVTPRYWNPPPDGIRLTEEEDKARYGPMRTTRDLEPWEKRHKLALHACDRAEDAVVGVNRWLRYGLGDRAGRLETEFRALLPKVNHILRAAPHSASCKKNEKHANPLLKQLTKLYRELGTAAINRDDGTFEEWFKFIEMMRSSLVEFLRSHSFLHQFVFRKPRGRIGDLLYRYLVAISDFECLLNALEDQFRRQSDDEFERAIAMIWLSVEARQEFEAVLTNRKRPQDAYPSQVHQKLRAEATRLLRKLEKTVSERSMADLTRTVWVMGVAQPTGKLPVWDQESRELRFDGTLCKRFRTRAVNQELVLQSFQELNWSPRIDDPLKSGKRHETIRQLNTGNKVIRFRSDGRGDGICWELRQPPK